MIDFIQPTVELISTAMYRIYVKSQKRLVYFVRVETCQSRFKSQFYYFFEFRLHYVNISRLNIKEKRIKYFVVCTLTFTRCDTLVYFLGGWKWIGIKQAKVLDRTWKRGEKQNEIFCEVAHESAGDFYRKLISFAHMERFDFHRWLSENIEKQERCKMLLIMKFIHTTMPFHAFRSFKKTRGSVIRQFCRV